MASKKNLEDTIIERVRPFIAQNMEKTWGFAIPKLEEDITSKLAKEQSTIPIRFSLNYSDALQEYKKEFFRRELQKHQNISLLANLLGVSRRSIHRSIKELGIIVPKKSKQEQKDYFKAQAVYKTLREALMEYRSLFKAEKMDALYETLPNLSKTIAHQLPDQKASTWKSAKHDFEIRYLRHHISLGDKLKDVAKKIGIRAESLSRKLKVLGLR
jgi:transcriptional regulator with PAS, ATPase and Fis domain